MELAGKGLRRAGVRALAPNGCSRRCGGDGRVIRGWVSRSWPQITALVHRALAKSPRLPLQVLQVEPVPLVDTRRDGQYTEVGADQQLWFYGIQAVAVVGTGSGAIGTGGGGDGCSAAHLSAPNPCALPAKPCRPSSQQPRRSA